MRNKRFLLNAIKNGDVKEVETLIEDIDINDDFDEGRKLLHIAAENGQIDIVKLLIDKGAKLDVKDKRTDKTPLYNAVIKGHKEIVEFLIESRANINVEDAYGSMPLYYAIVGKHIEIAKFLIENGANVNKKDKLGKIPLHYVAEEGQESIVALLIKKGKKHNVNIKDNFGNTPLYYAFMKNHSTVVGIFLDKKANINIEYEHGETLLHIAAKKGRTDMVNLLVNNKNCNVNAEDYEGYTPLWYAIEKKYENIIRLLINNGANVNIEYERGETLLHIATKEGRTDMVNLLVKNKTCNLNAKDHEGKTSLFYAINGNHEDIVKLLVSNGADIDLECEDGMTFLHIAVVSGSKKNIVSFLIEKSSKNNIDKKDESGYTPMRHAIKLGRVSIASLLIENGVKFDKSNLEDLVGTYIKDTDNVKVEDLIKNIDFLFFVEKVISVLASSYKVEKKSYDDYMNCLKEKSILGELEKIYKDFRLEELFDLYCICKLYISRSGDCYNLKLFQEVSKKCKEFIRRFCDEFKEKLYDKYLFETKDNNFQVYEWLSIYNNMLRFYKNILITTNLSPETDCLLSLFCSKITICNIFLIPQDRDVINDIFCLVKQMDPFNENEYEIIGEEECDAASNLSQVVVGNFDTTQRKSITQTSCCSIS